MEEKIVIKIHENYRKVVSVCDKNLLGKNFEEGEMQLDVNETFYGGEELNYDQATNLIKSLDKDSPSYNIVGENSVDLCLKQDLISEEGINKVSNIPFAMVF